MGQFMHTFSILARLLTEVHQSTSCFLKILVNIFTVRSNCILIFLLLFLKISHLKETSRVGAHSLFQVVVNVPAHHRLIIFSFLFSEKLSACSLLLFMILLSKLSNVQVLHFTFIQLALLSRFVNTCVENFLLQEFIIVWFFALWFNYWLFSFNFWFLRNGKDFDSLVRLLLVCSVLVVSVHFCEIH